MCRGKSAAYVFAVRAAARVVVGVVELADEGSIPRVGDGVNEVSIVFGGDGAGEVAEGVAAYQIRGQAVLCSVFTA